MSKFGKVSRFIRYAKLGANSGDPKNLTLFTRRRFARSCLATCGHKLMKACTNFPASTHIS